MSIRTLNRKLEHIQEETVERIADTVETLGLDPDADEVLDTIKTWFGPQLSDSYEEWIA